MSNGFSVSNGVWGRISGPATISRRDFWFLFMGFTTLGLALSFLISGYTENWMQQVPGAFDEDGHAVFEWVGPVNILAFFIPLLIIPFIGVFMSSASSNWVISFIGYLLIAGSFGALLGPTLAMYTDASIANVMLTTLGLSIGLGAGGYLYPKSLENWGGALFWGLLGLIIGRLIVWIFFGAESALMTLLDWAGVLIFSGYIIYDVNRAKFVTPTLDNAVDCAVALYLDILNLFLTLLRLMGQRK